MKVIGYHVTHRLTQDVPLVSCDAHRRALARSVLTIARPFRLLAFRWADTHGHSEALGEWEDVAELARRLEIGIQRTLGPGVPFQRAHLTPIHDLKHLGNTFLYVVSQNQHHGIGNDPFHEASNVPDLLRMRGLGASTCAHVSEYLSRVRRADILAAVGLEDPDGAGFVDGDIADAAAAAMGIAALTGRSRRVTVARAASVQVCRKHLSTSEIADWLGTDRRTIQRLGGLEPNRALVRAIEQQLTMRTRYRTALELSLVGTPQGMGRVALATADPDPRHNPVR